MAREERQYTAEDLYGANGRPHASDIDQDNLFNCYFLAPVGALGEQQPDRIRDAIGYNAETGDFTVRLYRPPNAQERASGQTRPIEESLTVSQEDIRYNIRRDGGGTVDNNRERTGPLWPTVLEAGFAELYGRDSQGRVNLDRAYDTLGDYTRGGALADGTYALTGESGRNLRIRPDDAPPLRATGPDHVERPVPPPYQAPAQSIRVSTDAAYTEVAQALATGRPVSMATQGRDVRDGLEESHAYMVVGVSRDPRTNEALVTLRNPYGNNQRAAEGNQNIGAGWNAENPEITVNLNRLVREGSFAEFNIGPSLRVQDQQQSRPESATPGRPTQQAPAQATPVPAGLTDPRDSSHPDHRLYKQIEAGVARIDAEKGRTFDATSERMTMGAFLDAKAAGITSADHITINETGKRQPDGIQIAGGTLLFVVQGQDPSDPAARRSITDVGQAIERPVEQSLQKLDAINPQQTQRWLEHPSPPTQDDPASKSPRL